MKYQSVNKISFWVGRTLLAGAAIGALTMISTVPSYAWGGGNNNSKSSPCTSIDNGHRFAQNGLSDVDTLPTIVVAGDAPCPPFKIDIKKQKMSFHWPNAPKGSKDINFHIDPNELKNQQEKVWNKKVDGGEFGGADEVHYKIVPMPGSPSGYGMEITQFSMGSQTSYEGMFGQAPQILPLH